MSNSIPGPNSADSSDIAIIGMNCRLPGANNLDEFWGNLKSGEESIVFLKEDELKAAGLPDSALNDPRFVKAAARIGRTRPVSRDW